MKEVIAVIRINMVNKTKEALLTEGFSAITCRKVLGRGKQNVNFQLIEDAIEKSEITSPALAEELSEIHRLIPKRMLIIAVNDEDIQKIISCIIDINQTGNPGDGKIFVRPLEDCIRIRTGEAGIVAI